MKYSDFFNAYDTVGTQHTGFLQSMDFSTFLSDIPMLNELTMALMDAHLYNELSESLVMRQWAKYMEYNKVNDRLEILAQFYTDFVHALYAKLTKSEKWFELLETDFTSISVTELETINHGKKETEDQKGQGLRTNVYGADILQKDFGQTQDTNAYGADITQTEYGQTQDTNAYGADVKQQEYGATQTATTYGATSVTRAYDKVTVDITHGQDTHQIGAAHVATSNTTTNQIYPLGASDFVNDNKSVVSGTQDNNAQTNTDTWGSKKDETAARNDTESSIQHIDQEAGLAHTDVTTTAAKTDTLTGAAHTDVESRAARTDTLTGSAHTDVESRASRTDTVTDAQRTDTQTIKAYTDTINRVKHIVISPEKYFEIEKELADIGVYDLMLEAVKATMVLSVWEEGEFLW